MHRAQAVSQTPRVHVADLRCGGGDQSSEGVDQFACLVEVGLILRIVGESTLDRCRAEEVHRCCSDDLDRADICNVSRRLLRIDRLVIRVGKVVFTHAVLFLNAGPNGPGWLEGAVLLEFFRFPAFCWELASGVTPTRHRHTGYRVVDTPSYTTAEKGVGKRVRDPLSQLANAPSPGRIQHTRSEEPAISDPRTNDKIRVPEVRLVGPSGEQVGVVSIEHALRLAADADLDLVEVAPNSKPPVAKIMDFGKFKYEAAQKAKEARRNQANTVLKEVRFRLKIDTHDYETKTKRAIGFLAQGDKVKAMILFRGREQSRPEQGVRLLQKFAEDIVEFGTVESSPRIDGRNMVMVIAPLKNKSDAKAEQNARRAEEKATRKAAENSDTTESDSAK